MMMMRQNETKDNCSERDGLNEVLLFLSLSGGLNYYLVLRLDEPDVWRIHVEAKLIR
jgi:hypothetical protein